MKTISFILFFFIIALTVKAETIPSRDRIRIVGSSTLYPFITIVAERFGKNNDFKTPIVESNGTGTGISLFCSTNSLKAPDIVNASRRIKPVELEQCHKNGVKNVREIIIAYDGIVVITSANNEKFNLTLNELFLAIADLVPKEGKLVRNFYNYWNEINHNFPKHKIEIYGPSYTSGTREAFADLVLLPICLKHTEYVKAFPDIKQRKIACKAFRKDSHYIDMGDNDNVIIHKVTMNKNSLGIIGYNFLEENQNHVTALAINQVMPNFNTIKQKTYPLSRALYLYINEDHIKLLPEINDFISELQSESATGEYGYLSLKGFIKNH